MKLLIALFVFEAAVFMNAQPVKGSFAIGGTLMYSSNSTSITDTQTEIDGEYTRTEINIGPKIGFYVSDHFMLGLSAGYNKVEEMQEYSHSSQLSSTIATDLLFINPFLRINHYPDEYWGIFLDISLSLGFGNEEGQWYYITNRNNIIDKVKSDITLTTFLLSPGLSVNLSSRISLEASLGIIYFSNTTSEIVEPDIASTNPKKTDTDLGVSFDLSNLSFGIMVFL